MNEIKANLLATTMTIVYTLLGLGVVFFRIENWATSLPLVLFYFMILVNTHLSVNFFLGIIPKHSRAQIIINASLLLIYIGLALNLNDPFTFMLAATLLFAVSTVKYLLLVEESPHKKILWRKIRVETLGTMACVLTILGIVTGYPLLATSLWTACFLVANIYLLSIEPLYKITDQ